ncbi:hypothetical protein BURPS406E_D0496 [Burkholderia pseudomallei 406e]|uniref:Uncharacterized protein n=1 Tax=Burkholderia pseudomallei 1710a TaxID=320371 RepID=A0A0E1VS85_BURPE|nr:hypothetical protein BURPS406E_D0496 [Burkholderia pseudomallei 406e]EDO89403.1 hypothetical protein BURPSPAST_AC0420 [Burkholderia pseudomallei Pasteur 52237]EET02826.1 hypothetical protein BURPS1710A_A1780 [Burkholderia pseudomallei 1710a]
MSACWIAAAVDDACSPTARSRRGDVGRRGMAQAWTPAWLRE